MIPITIINTSPEKRTEWCSFAVPFDSIPAGTKFGYTHDRRYRVVVGRDIGIHSKMVHVECREIQGKETYKDSIDFSSQPEIDWEFEISDWVGDRLTDMVTWPTLIKFRENDKTKAEYIYQSNRPNHDYFKVNLISSNPAERVYEIKGRPVKWTGSAMEEGLPYFRTYLYVMSGQDTVDFDLRLGFSNPAVPETYADVDVVRTTCKEKFVIDRAAIQGSNVHYAASAGVWAANIDYLGARIADGTRVEIQGTVLAAPEGKTLDDMESIQPDRVKNIRAAEGGPLLGCAGTGVWNDKWLCFRSTPKLPGQFASIQAAYDKVTDEFNDFITEKNRIGSYWNHRPEGLNKNPGDTGDQPAFNATKGGEVVTAGNPLALYYMPYNVTSQMRPVGHYTEDLRLVTRAEFPKLKIWTGRPHPLNEFNETLGKGNNVSPQHRPDTKGWMGEDEQHAGGLWEAALYALTGRLWLRDLLAERSENWKLSWNESAGRAIGRTWTSAMNAYWLLNDPEILTEIRNDFNMYLGNYADHITGPLKIYSRFNDPRALTDEHGRPVDCANWWQTGLFIHGLWAFYLVTGDQDVFRVIDLNATGLLQYGWFKRDHKQPWEGEWMCADYTAFNDGQLPTADYYKNNGNVAGLSHSTGWFTWWVMLATDVAGKIAHDRHDTVLYEKYLAIKADNPAWSWRDSQWSL